MTLDAYDLVTDNYEEYARFVNNFRAIPDARDGLKRVQRRILSTLTRQGGHDKFTPSSTLVGECIKYYHPHEGNSIYGAAVNMVHDDVPMLKGQGNFGCGGLTPMPAAAHRYTKLKLSQYAQEHLAPLFQYSEFFENENDYWEPVAIPTAVPYCLYNGAVGIGVGCSTVIPPLEEQSIREIVKALILGKEPPYAIPRSPGGGRLEITPDELVRLNEDGVCRVRLCADIEWRHDDHSGVGAYEISNVPSYVNLTKIFKVFEDEIEQDLIFVRNESTTEIRIVVGRNKRIKRISDHELYERLQKICSRSITFRCVVAHEGKAVLMPPVEMIRVALQNLEGAHQKFLDHEIQKVDDQIVFEKVKKPLAEMIMHDKNKEDIIAALQQYAPISDRQYSEFVKKSISALRSAKSKDVEKLERELRDLKSEVKAPLKSYGKRFNWI